jgi:hypothetical protein
MLIYWSTQDENSDVDVDCVNKYSGMVNRHARIEQKDHELLSASASGQACDAFSHRQLHIATQGSNTGQKNYSGLTLLRSEHGHCQG